MGCYYFLFSFIILASMARALKYWEAEVLGVMPNCRAISLWLRPSMAKRLNTAR